MTDYAELVRLLRDAHGNMYPMPGGPSLHSHAADAIEALEAQLADLEGVEESNRGLVKRGDHYKAKAEAAEARIAELEADFVSEARRVSDIQSVHVQRLNAEKARAEAAEARVKVLTEALMEARANEMRAYGPIPMDSSTASIVGAVQEWVNQRGGEETLEQIVAMTAEAIKRAALAAVT